MVLTARHADMLRNSTGSVNRRCPPQRVEGRGRADILTPSLGA